MKLIERYFCENKCINTSSTSTLTLTSITDNNITYTQEVFFISDSKDIISWIVSDIENNVQTLKLRQCVLTNIPIGLNIVALFTPSKDDNQIYVICSSNIQQAEKCYLFSYYVEFEDSVNDTLELCFLPIQELSLSYRPLDIIKSIDFEVPYIIIAGNDKCLHVYELLSSGALYRCSNRDLISSNIDTRVGMSPFLQQRSCILHLLYERNNTKINKNSFSENDTIGESQIVAGYLNGYFAWDKIIGSSHLDSSETSVVSKKLISNDKVNSIQNKKDVDGDVRVEEEYIPKSRVYTSTCGGFDNGVNNMDWVLEGAVSCLSYYSINGVNEDFEYNKDYNENNDKLFQYVIVGSTKGIAIVCPLNRSNILNNNDHVIPISLPGAYEHGSVQAITVTNKIGGDIIIGYIDGTIIISRPIVTVEEEHDDNEHETESKENNKPTYLSIVKNDTNYQIDKSNNNNTKKKLNKNSNNYSIQFKEIYCLKVPFSICGMSYGNLLGNFQNDIDLPVRLNKCKSLNSNVHNKEFNQSFSNVNDVDECNAIVDEIVNHLIDCIDSNNSNANDNINDNNFLIEETNSESNKKIDDFTLDEKLFEVIIDFDNNNKYINYTNKQLIVATYQSIHVFSSEESNDKILSLKADYIDKLFDDIF